MSDAVIVINDYRGVKTLQRTRKSGSKATSVSISAEPIAVVLDAKTISRPAVDAYVKVLREQIGRITFNASPATLEKRKAQAKAFAAGETQAVREFGGGRMGAMAPNQTSKLFHNSGRLAAGITANWSPEESAWIVRFPANRFNPEFMQRPGAQGVLNRLVDLVPALRQPLTPEVHEAIEKAQQAAIIKGQMDRGLETARLAVDALQLVARVLAA